MALGLKMDVEPEGDLETSFFANSKAYRKQDFAEEEDDLEGKHFKTKTKLRL